MTRIILKHKKYQFSFIFLDFADLFCLKRSAPFSLLMMTEVHFSKLHFLMKQTKTIYLVIFV